MLLYRRSMIDSGCIPVFRCPPLLGILLLSIVRNMLVIHYIPYPHLFAASPYIYIYHNILTHAHTHIYIIIYIYHLTTDFPPQILIQLHIQDISPYICHGSEGLPPVPQLDWVSRTSRSHPWRCTWFVLPTRVSDARSLRLFQLDSWHMLNGDEFKI